MNALPRFPRTKRLLISLCAFSLLAPSLAPPLYAQDRLPALGEAVSEDLSVGNERRIGEQIMRNIRADPDYLDDPVLQEYLLSIWQPLVAAAHARGDITPDVDTAFSWEPFLVRDRTVNAFALPGGYVGVHLGLIAMTATRDELASVLAHELTHITQRHIVRGMVNSQRQSLLSLAAIILGVLAAGRSNRSDAPNAIITGGQALAVQGQLNFSRDLEREADRIGFGVLTRAGFAPGGMAAMFEKLDQSSRLNDSGGFPYLRTHPLSTERIGEARARLGTATPAPPVSVLAHTVAQARSRVLMDSRIDALRRWQGLDMPVNGSVSDKLLVVYGKALSSLLLRDWARAEAATQLALGLVRGSPRSDAFAEREVVLLQAELLLARGDAVRAAEVLKPYDNEGMPHSRAVMLLQAQAAIGVGQAAVQRSTEEMQTWISSHPHDATAWAQLGRSWEALGHHLRALRAEAESRIAVGDLIGGVDRLRAGQKLARTTQSVDFIEASVIEARLREIENQARRRELEERGSRG
ncbi:M48 family metalloprotease [Sphaerotilaceae bacterium SBD11-9]